MRWKVVNRPVVLVPSDEYRLVISDKSPVIEQITPGSFRKPHGSIHLYPAIVTQHGLAGVTGTGDNFWYSVIDVPTEPKPYVAYMVRTRWGDFIATLETRA